MLFIDPATPPWRSRRRRFGRALKIVLITLGLVLVGLVTVVAVWGGHRYAGLVALGRQTQARYESLNKTFPFAPPSSGRPAAAGRWRAMLRARAGLLGALGPDIKAAVGHVLAAKRIDSWQALRDLLPATGAIESAVRAHEALLKREKMSLDEYQWLLGRAILSAMDNPERFPAGKGYWDVLRRSETLSAGRKASQQVKADKVHQALDDAVGDVPAPPDEIIAALRRPDLAGYAVDWMVLAAQWVEVEHKPGAPAGAAAAPGGPAP